MRMIQAIFIDFLCIGYVPCPIAYIMEKMEVKSEKVKRTLLRHMLN